MKTTDLDKKKKDEKKPRGDLRREKKIYLEKDNPRQNLSFILMIVSFILFIYSTYGIKKTFYQDAFFILFMAFASLDVFFKKSMKNKKVYLYINLFISILYIAFVILKAI